MVDEAFPAEEEVKASKGKKAKPAAAPVSAEELQEDQKRAQKLRLAIQYASDAKCDTCIEGPASPHIKDVINMALQQLELALGIATS